MASLVSSDFIGVDIGAFCFRVGHLSKATGLVDIALNGLSGRESRLLVSLSERGRAVGETAADRLNNDAANTAGDLLGLLSPSFQPSKHTRFHIVKGSNGAGRLVAFDAGDDEKLQVTPQHLLAMVLQQARQQAASLEDVRMCVALPDGVDEDTKAAVVDAGKVAGFPSESFFVVSSSEALAEAYLHRHKATDSGEQRNVLVMDVGQATTTVSIFKATFGEPMACSPLVPAQSCSVGVASFDDQLWAWAVEELKAKHGVEVKAGTRKSARLLREVRQ